MEFSGDVATKQEILQGMSLVKDYIHIVSGKPVTNTMVVEHLLELWKSQGREAHAYNRADSFTSRKIDELQSQCS